MLDQYVQIGYTKKAYGAKGQIKIVVEDVHYDDFVNSDFVFIKYMGKPLPFFIETIEEMGDLLLKVEEVGTPEEARRIASKELFLREKDLSEKMETIINADLEYGYLINYEIFNAAKDKIGKIKEVQEFPQQEMALVNYNDNEIYIPLHADLIEYIDRENKMVIIQLPDGLLEL